MHEAKSQFDQAGAVVIGVGTKEHFQAQNLIDKGMSIPLLMDPDNLVRTAVGADAKLRGRAMLSLKGGWGYLKAYRQRRDYGLVMSEALNRPTVSVFDADQNLAFGHVGQRLADYPTVATVLAELGKVTRP